MLIKNIRPFRCRQNGMILFLAMVVLVAVLMGTVALFRTVDSGAMLAGNIAMQKSATYASDAGVNAAATWLSANSGSLLFNNAAGYVANGLNEVPGTNQTWQEWWTTYTGAHAPVTMASDAGGNVTSYIIQRMCDAVGDPKTVICAVPPSTNTEGNNQSTDALELARATSVYYRITTRVEGPRNTISMTQTIVSL